MSGWKAGLCHVQWSFESHLESENSAVKSSYLISAEGSYQCCNLPAISLCLFMAWVIIAFINLSSLGHGFHSQSLTQQTSKDHLDFGEESNSLGKMERSGQEFSPNKFVPGKMFVWFRARASGHRTASPDFLNTNLSGFSQWKEWQRQGESVLVSFGYFYHQSS